MDFIAADSQYINFITVISLGKMTLKRKKIIFEKKNIS